MHAAFGRGDIGASRLGERLEFQELALSVATNFVVRDATKTPVDFFSKNRTPRARAATVAKSVFELICHRVNRVFFCSFFSYLSMMDTAGVIPAPVHMSTTDEARDGKRRGGQRGRGRCGGAGTIEQEDRIFPVTVAATYRTAVSSEMSLLQRIHSSLSAVCTYVSGPIRRREFNLSPTLPRVSA